MRVLPHSVPLSDRNLVAGLLRNDPQALEQAYGRYSARLLGFLLRLSPNRDVAEDLFQDAWCQLASSGPGLHPETDLFAWLLIVARNRYYEWARRASRQKPTPLSSARSRCWIAKYCCWSAWMISPTHEPRRFLELRKRPFEND